MVMKRALFTQEISLNHKKSQIENKKEKRIEKSMEVLLFIKECESFGNIYLPLTSAAPSLLPETLKMNAVNKTIWYFYLSIMLFVYNVLILNE